jgi:hypothetical protein
LELECFEDQVHRAADARHGGVELPGRDFARSISWRTGLTPSEGFTVSTVKMRAQSAIGVRFFSGPPAFG